MLFDGPFIRYLDQDTLREKYNMVRKIAWAFRYDIYNSSICISPFSRQRCMLNRPLGEWLNWVNRNIILNLGLDSEFTTRVKLRIAASMLNKVDNLSDIENVQIFTNLKDNINKELSDIVLSELPF